MIEHGGDGITRRGMLRAAAWAAPAIAVVSAAPLAAASGGASTRIALLNATVGHGDQIMGQVTDGLGGGLEGVRVSFTVLAGPAGPFSSSTTTIGGGFFWSSLTSLATAPAGEACRVRIASEGAEQEFAVAAYPEFRS